MKARVRLIVKGKVQGVFFRMFAQSVARKLGVTGWIRNNPDGTVEAVGEGDKKALVELVEKLKKGPLLSDVREVKQKWSEPTGEFTGFEIKY
ncbi:MAG: acylphosphatase [Candidatus Woesearchaeota archaeon]